MLIQIALKSGRQLDMQQLTKALGVTDITITVTPAEVPGIWAFYREGHSATLFMIEEGEKEYVVSMDRLASYDDYRFLPYLLDTLSLQLCDEPYHVDGTSVYRLMDEDWVAYCIGEEIAYVKCILSLGRKYYVSLPIQETNVYVDNASLADMGVCFHSSTPRIYGYIQYMLRHDLLPCAHTVDEEDMNETTVDEEIDVPQHTSIGTVLSWQTDGAETTESYCREDVALLMQVAERYTHGHHVQGVVLNDIATIYEHGIGIPRDACAAIHWFRQAMMNGDNLYAPTNMGDIYRKGLPPVEKDLAKAVDAYRQSTDPYAWYRIGQSYEEGWTAAPDMTLAMTYYHKAAEAGHHLAIKRLKQENMKK